MMDAKHPLLELVDVSKSYPSPRAADAPSAAIAVLRGVNLRLEAGRSLAVVGVSGSGKSTLLNIIGGLDTPAAGSVRIDGQDLATMGEKDLAAMRNRRVGFVFQQHHLLPHCTALENVLVPTLAGPRGNRKELQQRAWDLLRRVGLTDRAMHYPAELSGGECQRVAVARALIHQPRLLLADEPTGSLDRDSAAAVADLLAELACDADILSARSMGVSPMCSTGVLSSSSAARTGACPASILSAHQEPQQQRNDEDADKMSATHTGKMPVPHADKMSATHEGKMPSTRLAMIVVTHSRELARRMQTVMQLHNGTLTEAAGA